ncbi:MAG: fumarate hydratase [Candidatus Lokiarchaeota archaeon]|nr:fumarate hydratase [Candidatus Lokiarchaeota archaeon]MBD3198820.1 fumarate hydratase [Candidatus Lokiarchaeota archaeon]
MKANISLPIEDERVMSSLKIGDYVFLNGTIITARDQAHKRILEYQKQNKDLPESLKKINGSALYHCGPIIKCEDNTYRFISGGPTTSQRMDKMENDVIRLLGIKFVIGKGGMNSLNTKNNKVVYLSYTGGCGAIVQERIEYIENVIWKDLGLCEAIWFLKVKEFGPLIITQANGKNLYK